ncbi:unnamed protein product [Coccothraustes coccothraustes]
MGSGSGPALSPPGQRCRVRLQPRSCWGCRAALGSSAAPAVAAGGLRLPEAAPSRPAGHGGAKLSCESAQERLLRRYGPAGEGNRPRREGP